MRSPKLSDARVREMQGAEHTRIHAQGGDISVGIITPNPYRVGIVGLAPQILLRLANSLNVSVDRYYLDAPGEGLRSWGKKRPASELDILLCSVSYEPDLLILAKMLQSGTISPLARDRKEGDPLVILGGAAVMGATSLASEIADIVVWGEAESILPGIIETIRAQGDKNREELALTLAMVAGILKDKSANGSDEDPDYYRNFSKDPGFSIITTPYGEFGDSFLVEAVRGCPHGCRHCIACRVQAPFRPAAIDVVLGLVDEQKAHKVGLVGLGLADHPELLSLLEQLHQMGVMLATASLTTEKLSSEALKLITKMGQRTLTISPEAGTAELRRSLGKMADEAKWVGTSEDAMKSGFKSLRLYFMVGLPGETDEDLAAIGGLVEKMVRAFTGKVAVTLTPFVPKPHTAWQEEKPCGIKEYERRLRLAKAGLRGCVVRAESPREAMWQWELSQLDLEKGKDLLRGLSVLRI